MVTTPRILVVDDQRKIREPLAVYLRRQGFDVRTAENAAAMRLLMKQLTFELVILDVMLPDGDGMELCQQLQRRNATPVILLTARDATDDRVRGLDLGADDYVVKPFEPRELVSRINSVLRRTGTVAISVPAPDSDMPLAYRFSGLHFLPASGLLSSDEDTGIALSTMEGRLLTAFLRHPNEVLIRDRLIDLCVSPGNDIFDRAIDRQVSRLRSKLAHFLHDREVLITVWGSGYRLAADVSEIRA